MYDVVVVGAGAAGVAAAARLKAAGAEVLVLEAQNRVGGRAWSLAGRSGAAVDLGCGWLHSARENAWTRLAELLGFTLDRSPASWIKPALDVNFPLAEQQAYRRVFAGFEAKLEKATEAPGDRPAASLFGPEEERWAPLLNAFSGYYNGAPFEQISVQDYAAYQPTDDNWRVREGYGRLVATFAEPLPIRLSMPVRRIDHADAAAVRVSGDFGAVEARCVIVCVSTQVLADGGVSFDPPLPGVLQAASALPLGHVEKAFLKLAEPEEFPTETRLYGRTDTERTGSYTLRPMGLPVIECFFGGRLAAELEASPGERFAAFAVDELCAVFGSALRPRLSAMAESAWRADPFVRGAYSYARVGEAGARARLAEPASERIFFAGEACSAHAFSTAHGAYDTGVAAAEAALVRLGLTPTPTPSPG